MGFWGWRPLVMGVFMSVWVVSCNVVAETSTSVSPSASPQVTLTVGRFSLPGTALFGSPPGRVPTRTVAATLNVPTSMLYSPTPFTYTVQSGDTLLGIALSFNIDVAALRAANADQNLDLLQVDQVLIIPQQAMIPGTPAFSPTPTPLALALPTPNCYATRAGTLVCLGRVDNPLGQPVERIVVEARLTAVSGAERTQIATIEQAVVPANSFAPYRVLFDLPAEAYSGVSVVLLSADAVQNPDAGLLVLNVEEQAGAWEDGRFVVTATVTSAQPVEVLRAVVTLQNDDGQVIGYRVVALGGAPIEAGERLPLRLGIVPQADGERVDMPRYSIYVEARPRP